MSDTRRNVRGAGRGARRARFDDAIDGAVREMLDVVPPEGLRGRVLDQIDARSTNPVASAFRRNTRKIWWIVAPVAAAAVIVLAVLAPWRQTAPQVGPSASPSIAQVQPAAVAPPETPHHPDPMRVAPDPAPSAALPRPRPSPRGIEDRLVVAAVAPDDNAAIGIAPLAPIAAITVAAARPQDIAPKDIAISPLAPIAELQIAPLSPPDRRN